MRSFPDNRWQAFSGTLVAGVRARMFLLALLVCATNGGCAGKGSLFPHKTAEVRPAAAVRTGRRATASVSAAGHAAPVVTARAIPRPAVSEIRVGVVRVIGARQRFVLVELPSALAANALPTGKLLHCRTMGAVGGAATADLRVSNERRQPFVAADVLAGEPQVGDIVYLSLESETPVPARLPFPISSVLPTTPAAPPAQ